MTTYQYINKEHTVVAIIDDDGVSRGSCLASTLPDGTQIGSFEQSASEFSAAVVSSVQKSLDDFAKTRNYDGILSACTYATSTVMKFAREGQYCVDIRDNTWATLYSLMAEVEAGTKPMPATVEEVLTLLPTPTWPA